jgi:hypothetical protein
MLNIPKTNNSLHPLRLKHFRQFLLFISALVYSYLLRLAAELSKTREIAPSSLPRAEAKNLEAPSCCNLVLGAQKETVQFAG